MGTYEATHNETPYDIGFDLSMKAVMSGDPDLDDIEIQEIKNCKSMQTIKLHTPLARTISKTFKPLILKKVLEDL
jgi:hypothetical protein